MNMIAINERILQSFSGCLLFILLYDVASINTCLRLFEYIFHCTGKLLTTMLSFWHFVEE